MPGGDSGAQNQAFIVLYITWQRTDNQCLLNTCVYCVERKASNTLCIIKSTCRVPRFVVSNHFKLNFPEFFLMSFFFQAVKPFQGYYIYNTDE